MDQMIWNIHQLPSARIAYQTWVSVLNPFAVSQVQLVSSEVKAPNGCSEVGGLKLGVSADLSVIETASVHGSAKQGDERVENGRLGGRDDGCAVHPRD